MITIRTFAEPTQAAIVAGFLKDNQIEAVLLDENASTNTAARMTIPIRLQVPDQQAEQASSLLESFDSGSVPGEKEAE